MVFKAPIVRTFIDDDGYPVSVVSPCCSVHRQSPACHNLEELTKHLEADDSHHLTPSAYSLSKY